MNELLTTNHIKMIRMHRNINYKFRAQKLVKDSKKCKLLSKIEYNIVNVKSYMRTFCIFFIIY